MPVRGWEECVQVNDNIKWRDRSFGGHLRTFFDAEETMKGALVVKGACLTMRLEAAAEYTRAESARTRTILIPRRLSSHHLKTRLTVHSTTSLVTLIWAVGFRRCGLLCSASSRCNSACLLSVVGVRLSGMTVCSTVTQDMSCPGSS